MKRIFAAVEVVLWSFKSVDMGSVPPLACCRTRPQIASCSPNRPNPFSDPFSSSMTFLSTFYFTTRFSTLFSFFSRCLLSSFSIYKTILAIFFPPLNLLDRNCYDLLSSSKIILCSPSQT